MTSSRVMDPLCAQAREADVQALMRRNAPDLPDNVYYRDYEQGLRAIYTHIQAHLPEVLLGGRRVVDVGAGVGCFMVVTRAFGNIVSGEDLPEESGAWAAAYARVTRHWGLDIRRDGFHRYLMSTPFPYPDQSVDIFHFRGSLDAILRPFRADLDPAVQRLVGLLASSLRPGGFVQIHHNQDEMLTDIVTALRQQHTPLVLIRDEPAITRLRRVQ